MTRPPIPDIAREKKAPGTIAPAAYRAFGIVGIVLILASVALGARSESDLDRFFNAWLVSFSYFLSISLGALFFVLLHHLARATWSVVVRRFAEAIASNVLLMLLLFIPILIGAKHIYPWMDRGLMASEPALRVKAGWLSLPFFGVRFAVYFALWIWLSRTLFRRSVAQDGTGDFRLTRSMERLSGPGMVVCAVTLTLAAFDLLMSLDPHWTSTIFGVYVFAGSVLAFFASIPLVTWVTQRSGRLVHSITPEHYHDMGKLIFAFTIFWAYIAFSQYMLIWYGNIPEETVWFVRRQTNGWGGVGLALLFGHFVVPFLFLLPRSIKRRLGLLVIPALWVLAMHWIDLYWLVMPQTRGGRATPGLHIVDLTTFLGIGALFVGVAVWRLRTRSLIADRDPRITESLAFENA